MNIGLAAEQTGLGAKTLRYYEEIGLVAPARADNGYRDYSGDQVNELRFLARARSLGFSINECRALLSLYQDKSRASADVKSLAQDHLGQINAKIAELRAMHATLSHLIEACHGDDRPDCPILNELAR